MYYIRMYTLIKKKIIGKPIVHEFIKIDRI